MYGKELLHRKPRSLESRGMKRKAAWSAPPQRWIKINTDDSFWPQIGSASIRVVAQGQKGDMFLTAWRFLQHYGSPKEAEAEACLKGICLGVEWMRQPTCAETDCSGLVKALHGGGENRA
jgi:hypothetical protein